MELENETQFQDMNTKELKDYGLKLNWELSDLDYQQNQFLNDDLELSKHKAQIINNRIEEIRIELHQIRTELRRRW